MIGAATGAVWGLLTGLYYAVARLVATESGLYELRESMSAREGV